MQVVTVDAFAAAKGGGNPAGVAVFERELPDESTMLAVAAKVGYSETAFVVPLGGGAFKVRYFTPVEEVPLCGHATVGAFAYLLKTGMIKEGEKLTAHTGAGEIAVNIDSGLVWLDMAAPTPLVYLDEKDSRELLGAYGLKDGDFGKLSPAISNTGLADVMLPLASVELLEELKPDMAKISALSKKLDVTGVHAFAFDENGGIHCRNFAPLYGIDEESATGTSNGALTYYLYQNGLVKAGCINLMTQGETMGKTGKIYTRLTENGENGRTNGQAVHIRVGGSAIVRE